MILTKINLSKYMPLYRLLTVLFIICILPSCTHIHVPADATLANQLKEDFSKVTANDSNIYSAMLDNKEQMEAKEQLRLESLKKEKGAAFANQLYTNTWQAIQSELAQKRQALDDQRNNINTNLIDINKRLSDIAGKKIDSENTLEEAKALLKKAAEAQNQWNARHELFRQSIKSIADIAVAEETDADFNASKKLLEEKDTILKTEIAVVDVDDNGKVITTFVDVDGKVKEKKETIQSILKIDKDKIDKDSIINLIKANSGDLFDADTAPGIKIIILGLAVDLADKELKRNKLDIAYLEKVVNLLETQKNGSLKINETIDLISEAEQSIEDRIIEGSFKKTDTVLETINILRKSNTLKYGVSEAFKAAGIYSMTMIGVGLELELQLAMLDHEYSIQLSSINAQEHEALISRGLQGLAAYHEGGITPETVANFLRAVQAVALGVIGAGVL